MSWEAWTAIGTAICALIAAFSWGITNRNSVIKHAEKTGKTGERMETMRDELTKVVATVVGHTAQIAEHDGSFKAIDVRLEFIQKLIEKLDKGQEALSQKLDKVCMEGTK
jgi:hypothetical protein